MGCNCGGRTTTNKEWVYQPPSHGKGVPKVYQTEVEARAAQIRNGGGTITVRTK